MTGPSDRASVHLLTVTLQGVRPPVKRRLEVPSAATLGELNAVLMVAFDWEDGHLHQFEVGEAVYGPGEMADVGFLGSFPRRAVRDEDAAVLGRLLPRPGDVTIWTYDLGDDWRHRIEVMSVQQADPETIYPRCTGGSGLAPEEDTGRERRGTFGVVQRERLNAVLQRLLGRRGRDLQADEPALDEVFAGLFPEIDMTSAGPGCDCEECEGADGEVDTTAMPVLRPLPDDELASAAAATPLVSRAVALAGWLGSGRPLTPSKVLRPAEADEAVARLGLDRPLLPPHRGADPQPFGRSTSGRGGRKRSAKDQPALHAIWGAALTAGLIEIRGQKARPGPGLAVWQEPADPGRRLESWGQLLAGYLRAHAEAERSDRSWYVGPSHGLLPASVMMLYTSVNAPLWPGILALGGILFVEEDADPLMLLTLPETAARWADVLERWAVTGAVAASDVQEPGELGAPLEEGVEQMMAEVGEALGASDGGFPGAGALMEPALHALRKGPFVEVTPFGRYCLARVLRAHGLSVPTLGDLVDAPPGELLQALHQHDPAAAVEEARGWLDARGDARGDAWAEAVRDVVRSAAVTDEAGPVRRSVLPVIVGLVAEAAESLLDEWQADPLLAASVAVGRFAAGKGPEPTVGQFLWLAVDALSMALDDDEDFAELAGQLQVESMLAEPSGISAARRLDHPRAREVLHRLAQHLADRRLAGRLRAAVRGGHVE